MSGYYSPPTTLCADFYTATQPPNQPYHLINLSPVLFDYAHPAKAWALYQGYDGQIRFYFARPGDVGKEFWLELDGVFDGVKRNCHMSFSYQPFVGKGANGTDEGVAMGVVPGGGELCRGRGGLEDIAVV